VIWQDVVIGIGSVSFSLALLPAIWRRQPPPVITCALTTFWLWVYAVVFITLSLWFSAITGSVTALCWTILLYQASRSKN
jgi:hypothetical protein